MQRQSEDRRLFYGYLRDTTTELFEFRTTPVTSMLKAMVQKVLDSLAWTWARCAQAVFVAFLTHILQSLEAVVIDVLHGAPYTLWRTALEEADKVLNEYYFPLRGHLLARWGTWSVEQPGWLV